MSEVTQAANSASEISFLGTGDCGPVHGPGDGFPIERYSELVRPTLQSVDLRFGNCERQYSSRGTASETSPHGRQPPEMAKIFTDCGFDAVTIANNHMYDFGPEALLDTRALLLEKNIAVTGAGRDLDEARKPAIVERNGIKVGFLGYCSVIPEGGEAAPGKTGIAPLRVVTSYEPRGPHASPRVITRPDDGDMKMILDDVAALRRQVDIVIVAFHWGVIWVPRVIADYQVIAAHACIDAGADMILLEKSLMVLEAGVVEGRKVFVNIRKYVRMGASSNFGNMFSMLGVAFLFHFYRWHRFKFSPTTFYTILAKLRYQPTTWTRSKSSGRNLGTSTSSLDSLFL